MNQACSLLYIDSTNNIWKFTLNDSGELSYRIMYGEGKWAKLNIVDVKVLSFAVCVEEDGTIHIVYSNNKLELRYCTMRNKQWVGKTLYHMENEEFEMHDVKVEIIGEEMHIFYLLIANDGSEHGVLMHCRWNGKESKVNSLQDIILVPELKEHYVVKKGEKSDLYVFFLSDAGDEAEMKYCSFKKNKWNPVVRLYGVFGENVFFDVIVDKQEFHILNKHKEEDSYYIDYVLIDMAENIQTFNIQECNKEYEEPILFLDDAQLYCCWLEGNNVIYSFFEDEKWSEPTASNYLDKHPLYKYNCILKDSNESSIKTISIYGTSDPDLSLLFPNQIIKSDEYAREIQFNTDNNEVPKMEEILSLRAELQRLRLENKSFDKKISSLNSQVQRKQRSIEEYEDNVTKILEQKRKIEENCNVYLEVQQNSQKELEILKKQLADKTVQSNELQRRILESEQENERLQFLVDSLTQEERRLKEELHFEQNQSIMDRLLRRKSSEL